MPTLRLSKRQSTKSNGFHKEYWTNPLTAPYWQYCGNLHMIEDVAIYNDYLVVSPSLRSIVLDVLHSAHLGVSTMGLRARLVVVWSGMTYDIERRRQSCLDYAKKTPSQLSLPTVPSTRPTTPLEQIYADFFDCTGQHYLVVGDKLSGWSDIFRSLQGSPQAESEGLIHCLYNCFSCFGVPEKMSSDEGHEFISTSTKDFLSQWGVRHRLLSAYNPKSNGRAEVAVKSTKQPRQSNIDSTGILDSDCILRAIMQLCNTSDPVCNVSPDEIVFGRTVCDAFAFINHLEKFSNK